MANYQYRKITSSWNRGRKYMTDIEDVICVFYRWNCPIKLAAQETNFINSVGDSMSVRGLTLRQRTAIIRLIKKYADQLSIHCNVDINLLVENPIFRSPLRELSHSQSRKISIITSNNEKKIAVKFPYDEALVADIRNYKTTAKSPSHLNWATWNPDEFLWEFTLNEPNLLFLSNLETLGFTVDAEFSEYMREFHTITESMDQHIPMLIFENGKFSYKNTVDAIPQPESSDILEVLLHARKYGVTCWDDAIELALESNPINPAITKMLKNATGLPTISDADLIDFKDIIACSNNVLFVIPGGSELFHLEEIHKFLLSENYTNEQLSVLFRLDNSNSAGTMFNEYIVKNHLNNHFLKRVKFFFISGKIQRPLLEANKDFDIVIHFGTNSAHYSLTNFIKNHHNVISIALQNKNKELPLDIL